METKNGIQPDLCGHLHKNLSYSPPCPHAFKENNNSNQHLYLMTNISFQVGTHFCFVAISFEETERAVFQNKNLQQVGDILWEILAPFFAKLF